MKKIIDWICVFFSTTGFSGILVARLGNGGGGGTAGSILALFAQYLMYYLEVPVIWQMVAIVASFLLGLAVIGRAEKYLVARGGGRKWNSVSRKSYEVDHDLNQTNIDEVHGQFIAGLPVFLFLNHLKEPQVQALLAFAFFFFRWFDTQKPLGIRKLEKKFPGAFGVMIDDTVAGVLAGLALGIVLLTVLFM